MLFIINQSVLAASSFMPHGMCYLWKPGLVGIHVISNAAITLAYFSIPVTLVYIVRNRQDIPFNFIFFLFAAFIILCGVGHGFDVWTLWHPNYWVSAYIRAVTALVSVATAIAIYQQIPKIIAFPSTKQLEKANQQIQQEIEERKQIELELVKEKQFVQALLENLSDGIVACNQDGILTLFNRATQEFHGLPPNSIPAEEWAEYYDLYGSDGKTLMQKHEIPLFRALKGESVQDVEMIIISKQGQARTILANGDPIITTKGDQLGAVVVMRDITERKHTQQMLEESEARFRKATQAAEAANKAKDSFLAHISHELRTPLNSIIGFTQILKKDSNLKEIQHQHLDCVYQSGQHLLILINDILDLSKITAKKLKLELNNFDFLAFLNNLANIARLQSQQKGLDFHFQLLPLVPKVVCGDETRLRQVLLNLLNNAIKFTKAGNVTFTVSFVEDLHKIRFQVKDTGVGIPAELLKTIFLPFEQVRNNHNKEGTGLGLAISSNLVQLMDSQIQIESTLGEGSTFWFDVDLPAVDSASVSIPLERQYELAGFHGQARKILVVDDNINNRQVLINWLKPLGFELLEAENGQQGLALTKSFQPELILLDIVMPIMDGIEMSTRIRQDSQFREIIIFAISANAKFTNYANSHQNIFDAFLSKPVNLNQLLDMLEAYLGLEWINAESTETELNISTQSLLIPDPDWLEELLNLANIGDIPQVIDKAESLEQLNKQYSSFAQQIKQLALNFQQQKLIALLENNLSK